MACGCEDLNDPAPLRTDPLLQTAGGRRAELGSSPTLSQPETRVRRKTVKYPGQVLLPALAPGQVGEHDVER
ncbi:MAG: hypothetical protein AB7S51_00780 [Porticoccaceae bacterium]